MRLKLAQNYAWEKLPILYSNSHCLGPTERSDSKKGVLEGIVELPQPFWYRLELRNHHLELTLPPNGAKAPTRKDYQAARAWAVRRF